jgi:hypothetical protein
MINFEKLRTKFAGFILILGGVYGIARTIEYLVDSSNERQKQVDAAFVFVKSVSSEARGASVSNCALATKEKVLASRDSLQVGYVVLEITRADGSTVGFPFSEEVFDSLVYSSGLNGEDNRNAREMSSLMTRLGTNLSMIPRTDCKPWIEAIRLERTR